MISLDDSEDLSQFLQPLILSIICDPNKHAVQMHIIYPGGGFI